MTDHPAARPDAAPLSSSSFVGARDRLALGFVLVGFFISGVAALIYQVIWQRLLVIFSGADLFSVTLIIAAFMAGLGAGSAAGGPLADRLSRRQALAWFAIAELAIGVFGLASEWLYYDVLYQGAGWLAHSPARSAPVLFVSLLWPTFFMGMSLPLLARALTRRLTEAAGTVAALYGCNTIGAAVGAVVATWGLLPAWGLGPSLTLAATLNFLCAAVVVPLLGTGEFAGSGVNDGAMPNRAPAGNRAEQPSGFSVRQWLLLYGTAGFTALSLEVVWFRILGVMLKSTAFTFGTLLGVYLAGLGAGALAGTALVRRSTRPALVFLGAQAAVAVYAAGFIAILIAAMDDWSLLKGLREHLAQAEPFDTYNVVSALRESLSPDHTWAERLRLMPGRFFAVTVALPAMMIGPATFLMGFSFPFLQKAMQQDLSRVGRRVGGLQVANIAGSLLGAVLTGWAGLTFLGTAVMLKILLAIGGVFLGLLVRELLRGPARSRAVAAGAVAVMAVIGIALPHETVLWATLHGTTPDRVIVAEDGTGLSLLKNSRAGFGGRETRVFVNGLSQSWLPYGDIHTALGALPLMVHPDPRDIAVIGLGSGDTVFSLAGRATVASVTCIEIVAGQLTALQRLAEIHPYPPLGVLFTDPRITHVAGDGRAYIARSGRKYDIIEADALRPSSAYSGFLYSVEYFGLLGRHLNKRGMAVTWSPSARVRDTFIASFPHVLDAGSILMGGPDPIAFDDPAIRARIADPAVREFYLQAGVEIDALLAPFLEDPPRSIGVDFDRSRLTDLNSDLFPKDEYRLPSFGR